MVVPFTDVNSFDSYYLLMMNQFRLLLFTVDELVYQDSTVVSTGYYIYTFALCAIQLLNYSVILRNFCNLKFISLTVFKRIFDKCINDKIGIKSRKLYTKWKFRKFAFNQTSLVLVSHSVFSQVQKANDFLLTNFIN